MARATHHGVLRRSAVSGRVIVCLHRRTSTTGAGTRRRIVLQGARPCGGTNLRLGPAVPRVEPSRQRHHRQHPRCRGNYTAMAAAASRCWHNQHRNTDSLVGADRHSARASAGSSGAASPEAGYDAKIQRRRDDRDGVRRTRSCGTTGSAPAVDAGSVAVIRRGGSTPEPTRQRGCRHRPRCHATPLWSTSSGDVRPSSSTGRRTSMRVVDRHARGPLRLPRRRRARPAHRAGGVASWSRSAPCPRAPRTAVAPTSTGCTAAGPG